MVTKAEMSKIMDILKTAYPRYYNNISRDEIIKTINLWTEMFSDTDLVTLAIAVKSLISHFQFPPTIADIRNEIVKLNNKKIETVDYWNKVYNLLKKGSYLIEKEFDIQDEIIKRYFGSAQRVREKARTENLNMEVEQSNFNKYAESYIRQEKEKLTIPKEILLKLEDIKMLNN